VHSRGVRSREDEGDREQTRKPMVRRALLPRLLIQVKSILAFLEASLARARLSRTAFYGPVFQSESPSSAT